MYYEGNIWSSRSAPASTRFLVSLRHEDLRINLTNEQVGPLLPHPCGRPVSPDEWNQTPAHAAHIIVIAIEAHPQRPLLDADPDAEQEGEERDRR